MIKIIFSGESELNIGSTSYTYAMKTIVRVYIIMYSVHAADLPKKEKTGNKK
jgi:hypothetical protein